MPEDKTPLVNRESAQATNLQPDAPGSVPGFPPAIDAMFGAEVESVDVEGSSTSVDSSQSEDAPTAARRPPTPRHEDAPTHAPRLARRPPTPVPPRGVGAAELRPPDSPDWRAQLQAAGRHGRPAGARPARPAGLVSGAGLPAASPPSLPSLPLRAGGRVAHVAPGADATSPPSPAAATGARTRGGLSGPA